jgi:ubiquinone/menaquinone biosynthesis C-methylase UbiE
MLSWAGQLPLTEQRILDVGCGTGLHLAGLQDLGAPPAHLFGVDLLEDRIAEAQKLHPEIHFACANAEELPYADNWFRLVFVGMVFSSILSDQMSFNIAQSINRVLRPGGGIVWYDFRYNSPRNRNVRGVPSPTVRRLFPSYETTLRGITLLPPLSRHLGPLTPWAYPLLAQIPFLRTHYIGFLRKPAQDG